MFVVAQLLLTSSFFFFFFISGIQTRNIPMSCPRESTAILSLAPTLSFSQKWKYVWKLWMSLERQHQHVWRWNRSVQVTTNWFSLCVFVSHLGLCSRWFCIFRSGFTRCFLHIDLYACWTCLCLASGKFDQPQILKIQAVPKKYGCLKLIWGLAQHQTWIRGFHFSLEVRLKTADRDQWSQQPVSICSCK